MSRSILIMRRLPVIIRRSRDLLQVSWLKGLLVGDAIIALRAIATWACSVLWDDSLWITGVCYAIVTLCAPACWAGAILGNSRLRVCIRDTHISLRGIATWAGAIFCDRHYLHDSSPLVKAQGLGMAVTSFPRSL